ncbi:hypothetical protein GCM10016234_30170 [Tianweitania populi]|uniref:Uncharacterized protein n=1 Tax=Tianweitania populi TaxID=1607949 RepID=A0A8J3DS22_9HYPH|nr:hypothetical protein GCM10016234_30170 [Tianweitania populi]
MAGQRKQRRGIREMPLYRGQPLKEIVGTQPHQEVHALFGTVQKSAALVLQAQRGIDNRLQRWHS